MRNNLLMLPFALLACACAHGRGAAPSFTPAGDPAFLYEGRIDDRGDAPVLIWQGSRVRAAFEGSFLALRFGRTEGQVFFDLTANGRTERLQVPAGEGSRIVFPGRLAGGRHTFALFKRSEASAGHTVFLGAETEGPLLAAAPPVYGSSMLFFGDSITAGACSEDGRADQWEDRGTHNSAKSYAALTAAAFGADYRNIAVSGMGVSAGYVEVKAGQVWDRVYPKADSPRADLSWKPDYIFVNLGENDYSFTRERGEPFPADFAARYIELVRNIRAAWPEARIILLRGGMYGGARGDGLAAAWEEAAQALMAGDGRINRYAFSHYSENHPRAADHAKMAAELAAWLRSQPYAPR